MFHRPTRSAGWFRGPIISGRHRVAEVSKRTLHCRVQDGIWPAFDDMQVSDSSSIQTRHSRRSSSLHARGYSSRQKHDIITKLKSVMPPTRLKFWENLPTAAVSDLIREHDW